LPIRLLVGLGNPGTRYERNRHNIGFMAVDAIVRRHGVGALRSKFQSAIAEGSIAGERVYVQKPQTYMNLSGDAVGEAARFYKIAPDEIAVIHDEIDLAPGKLKVKRGGGAAGHNGLRSIDDAIGEAFDKTAKLLGLAHALRRHPVVDRLAGLDRQVGANRLVDAVLDERDQPARHESSRAHRVAGPSDFAHLDDASRCHDLDPPTGSRRDDLERLRALTGIDHRLDPIALHDRRVAPIRRARAARMGTGRICRLARMAQSDALRSGGRRGTAYARRRRRGPASRQNAVETECQPWRPFAGEPDAFPRGALQDQQALGFRRSLILIANPGEPQSSRVRVVAGYHIQLAAFQPRG